MYTVFVMDRDRDIRRMLRTMLDMTGLELRVFEGATWHDLVDIGMERVDLIVSEEALPLGRPLLTISKPFRLDPFLREVRTLLTSDSATIH